MSKCVFCKERAGGRKGGVRFSKLKLFKIPRASGHTYTQKTQMLDKVIFKMMLRECKKIVLKMEKKKIYYIRQVPSAHSAYWLCT